METKWKHDVTHLRDGTCDVKADIFQQVGIYVRVMIRDEHDAQETSCRNMSDSATLPGPGFPWPGDRGP